MSMVPTKPAISTLQRVIAVLWPSFLVSGVATVLFFTAFDPREFLDAEVSRIGVYSIGFFLFWLLSMTSSLLTLYFQVPCQYLTSSTKSKEVTEDEFS